MLRNILLFMVVSLMAACGGGGGGSSSNPTDPNTVFQLFPANKFVQGNVESLNYTGADNIGGKYTGSFTERTEAQTTFLGQQAIPLLGQLQLSNTVNGAVISDIVTTYVSISATDRRLLGTSDSTSTTVTATTTAIPQTAKIGDFGVVGTYTDNAGDVDTESWRLDNGGNGNATIVLLSTVRDQSGAILNSSTTSTVIDKNGNTITQKLVLFISSQNVTITLNGS